MYILGEQFKQVEWFSAFLLKLTRILYNTNILVRASSHKREGFCSLFSCSTLRHISFQSSFNWIKTLTNNEASRNCESKTLKKLVYLCISSCPPNDKQLFHSLYLTEDCLDTHSAPGDELGSGVLTVIFTMDSLFSNNSSQQLAHTSLEAVHPTIKKALNPGAKTRVQS